MKNSWIPTRKGTDLNPQVTQSPTRLIIRGAPPGSELFHAVAQLFSGRMRMFHTKQQQAYSLSDVQYQRGQIDWGDGRATYTNMQGQEILELEVDVAKLKSIEAELLAEKKVIAPWEWALIELNILGVDVAAPGTLTISAKLNTPAVTNGYFDDGDIYEGGRDNADFETVFQDTPDPYSISFPSIAASSIKYLPEVITQKSTLLVNLKKFSGRPFSIDIHAFSVADPGHVVEVLGIGGPGSPQWVVTQYQSITFAGTLNAYQAWELASGPVKTAPAGRGISLALEQSIGTVTIDPLAKHISFARAT